MKQPDRIYVHLTQEPSRRWVCKIDTSVTVPSKNEGEFAFNEHTTECTFYAMDHNEIVGYVKKYLQRPSVRNEGPSIMDASEISREWMARRFTDHANEKAGFGILVVFEYTVPGSYWRVASVAAEPKTAITEEAVAELAVKAAQCKAAIQDWVNRQRPDLLALARDL